MKYYAILNEDHEIQPCQEIAWDLNGNATNWQHLVFPFRHQAEAWIEAYANGDEEIKELLHIVEFDPLDSFLRIKHELERTEIRSVHRSYATVLFLVGITAWVLGYGFAWLTWVL